MSSRGKKTGSSGSHAQRFATTRWSVVLAAGQSVSLESRRALQSLCQTYWFPVYTYVRRLVARVEDAQDLTQGFFAHLLEKDAIAKANPDLGRFRAFLLTALKNFLANERHKNRAEKRGGGKAALSLDFDSGESRYQIEPSHELTPEKLFERRWVLTLLDQVLGRLRAELTSRGKAKLFEQLKSFLAGDRSADSYAEIAAATEMTEGAVKVAVHRLRRRYRELLRDEIAQTVAEPDDIDDEIRELFRALAP